MQASAVAVAVLLLAVTRTDAFCGTPALIRIERTAVLCAAPQQRCARGSASAGRSTLSATAGDWTELKDEASGNVYFRNEATGETSWERPAPRDLEAAAATGEPLQSGKAEGWESIFAGFFSSLGASPEQMGMGRFDRNKFPELFPATLTEFAAPVDGDDADVVLFRPLLARTSLETRPLRLAFDADRDGWDARSFHQQVDRLGPGVVLARTEGGAVLGGYNPKGWVGLGEYRGSLAAFLYTWPDGDTRQRAIKLRKVGWPYSAEKWRRRSLYLSISVLCSPAIRLCATVAQTPPRNQAL